MWPPLLSYLINHWPGSTISGFASPGLCPSHSDFRSSTSRPISPFKQSMYVAADLPLLGDIVSILIFQLKQNLLPSDFKKT